MSHRYLGHATAFAVLLVLGACGAPSGVASERPGADKSRDPAGAATADESQPGSGDSSDGPIRLTVDGATYGFSVGRCDIIDEVVYVTAITDDAMGSFEATLPPWDHELAYAQRSGSVSARLSRPEGPSFNLQASPSEPMTSWDWTASGTDVEVTAVMANGSTGVESEIADHPDVRVDIQCNGGPFGSGPYAEQFAAQEISPIEPVWERAPGSVTIDLGGNHYEIAFLVHCQLFSESVSAEGTANDASVYLSSEGAGVNLDLLIGDRRAEEEGTRWHLPPDAELMEDFLFAGDDTTRTWSGPVVSDDGEDAEATITVECTEGDGFQSAGSGTIELDGVLHELDEVTACTIDGTAIDFFGRSTATDVALVVTGGGSQVLLGDETGQQSATRDVTFDLSGQRATWSGVLARGQQATIEIDCG